MAVGVEEKLRFTIMQNKDIYSSIVRSKTYSEFISESGNKKVNGYKDANLKEKRFKEALTRMVKDFS